MMSINGVGQKDGTAPYDEAAVNLGLRIRLKGDLGRLRTENSR